MRSIRFKVFALLLIPTISLIGLWAFAVSLTLTDVIEKQRYDAASRKYVEVTQALALSVGGERQASVIFLSAGSSAPRQDLDAGRAKTDAVVQRFRRFAKEEQSARVYAPSVRRVLNDFLGALDGLTSTRAAVDARGMTRVQALNAYDLVIDGLWDFSESSSVISDTVLYRRADAILAGARAMEMISRENSLIAGAMVTGGRMDADEHRFFVQTVANQRQLWARERLLLDDKTRAALERHLSSTAYADFRAMEDRIVEQARTSVPVDAATWQGTVAPLLTTLNGAHVEFARGLAADADDLGWALLLRLGLGGGLGLLAVLISVALSVRFGRRLTREMLGLRASATELADVRLPAMVERLGGSDDVDVDAEVPEPKVGKIREVSDLARSFATVQRTAIEAAVGQAELRKGVNQIFLNIARRNQSLLHRQLAMLDTLESRAEPDVLEDLFKLDHLTTRMRRHAEGLIILSGAAPGRGWRDPVRIVDVLRGAVAEVEDYARVAVLTTSQDAVVGTAVADVIHLLAELMENATSFSPPNTEVHVMADLVGNGLAVEIEDRGLGINPTMLDEINQKLANPPEFDLADTDQLGLFVVGRLAERHGISVSLRGSPYGGTTAIVLLPHNIVVSQHDQPLPRDRDELPAGPETPADVRVLRNTARMRKEGGEPESPAGPGGPRARARARAVETPPSSRPDPAGVPEYAAQQPPAAPRATEKPPPDSGTPADTHAGLPRRVRQENLAPQLRGKRSPQSVGGGGEAARSPEQTGAVIASMQEGWRRGRAEAKKTMRPADGEGPQ
ncbi:sensor histidine kinase [Actinomadura sp. HBU206391]|uniref:sensor histidine kinase n=1 Tax=Actinomadura sp. HBU206391 TaxID=2731692 RepID=UPI00164F5D05|nr:sensor histidine kinase [Actinomadura sp. HBU206391]MBC6458318.1 nitrate- and nitrite sensing domain-containing protein [Actinomadura sp. HBU206391]